MIVLIDIDGVLADFDSYLLKEIKKRLPEIEIPEKRDKLLRKNFSPEEKNKIDQICNEEGFFLNLKEIEGSIEGVKELAKKHDVFFCSSPLTKNINSVKEKQLWVKEKFGEEWIRKMIIAKDKTIIKGDILIDDIPEEIKGIKTPEWEQIIFDQPYNKHIKNKKRINWNNYKEIIKD